MRDYMREEWLAWQDLMQALEDLGVSRARFNAEGDTFVTAVRYWHHMKARLEDALDARVPVDGTEQKGSSNAR